MLPFFAGILVFLAGDVSFRLLATWLPRRLPTLALRDASGHLRRDRLAATALVHVIWTIGGGGIVLLIAWNALAPADEGIFYGEAVGLLILGAALAAPILFSLEILAYGVGRPGLAAKLGIGPPPANEIMPEPPVLEPDLTTAVAVVRACLRPFQGDVATIVRRPDFIEDWLSLDAASLALEIELRERALAHEPLSPATRNFTVSAREQLNNLRLAAIDAGVFDSESVGAAEARRRARLGGV